ncbi:MAG: hypothetical protein AAF682_07610 [Planctomycetota bacterium]
MSRSQRALLALVLGFVVPLLIAEVAIQVYVDHIAQRTRIFTHDTTLGWRVLPDLDVVRRNADGEPWRIVTDEDGFRGPSNWDPDAERRLLILGDSFAFGEGVDIEERFDSILTKGLPQLSIVNLGVMGYGTDQEVIAARPWMRDLGQGDVLLLLTFGNDFYDIARRKHASRSKPWFWLDEDGAIDERLPQIGLAEILRDRFYTTGLLVQHLGPGTPMPSRPQVRRARELYTAIVATELYPLADRGIEVWIAHHGARAARLPFPTEPVFERIETQGVRILPLDPVIREGDPAAAYLADGHWTAEGHRRVGAYLGGLLAPTTAPTTADAEAF